MLSVSLMFLHQLQLHHLWRAKFLVQGTDQIFEGIRMQPLPLEISSLVVFRRQGVPPVEGFSVLFLKLITCMLAAASSVVLLSHANRSSWQIGRC